MSSKNARRNNGAKQSAGPASTEQQRLATAKANVAALAAQHQQLVAQAAQKRDILLKWQGVVEYLESLGATPPEPAPTEEPKQEDQPEVIPS